MPKELLKSLELTETSQTVYLNEIKPTVGTPHLPVELLGLIPLHLRQTELLACCATTRALRTFSRAHLFRNVMVVDTTQFMREDEVFLIQKEELDAIMALFPDIGDLIRTLTLFHFTTLNISHWITNPSLFDVAKLCAFLSNCSRLETFSISRPFGYSMGSTGNRVQWDTLGIDIQNAIRQVTKLPTLKDLRIHDHMVFETTQSFCDQFAFDDQSSVVHLELACMYFLDERLPRSVAGQQATLKTLKMGYVGGPFMPFTLLSAASPFDVSQLQSLELVGIAPLDDDWMTRLLDAQKSPSTLKRLELIGVEGYPQETAFLRSLERFTSIETLHISEDLDPFLTSYKKPTSLDCLPFWLYSLPIRHTIQELVIHETDLQHDSSVMASLDGIVSDGDMMPLLRRAILRVHLKEMESRSIVKEKLENRFLAAKSKKLFEVEYFYHGKEVRI